MITSAYKKKLHKLPENILTTGLGIAFIPNSFLFQLSNEMIHRLNAAGMTSYLISFYHTLFHKPILKEPIQPQVFNVDDLSFGFYIWWVASGISALVFVCEILILIFYLIRKRLSEFFGLILFVTYWRKFRN